ncbi:hypothetical protein GCM10010969_03670 [Saccharibacillus kuerlensis]|uniref:NUMOD3 motif-containing protein n=1 Tax=Saccharibacillus kuerlensis TaxID=459527 RepID=A0ABQ2KSB5_9BACL|nr:hypothetical protein GCM10010969_03670 [Saccharibacillus kuerlensis]
MEEDWHEISEETKERLEKTYALTRPETNSLEQSKSRKVSRDRKVSREMYRNREAGAAVVGKPGRRSSIHGQTIKL